jgi:NADPH-dependent F420 reductase
MGRIAIIGGTGPEGVGLGLRFTLSGREVRLGSREAARARESAAQANARLASVGCALRMAGDENRQAIEGAEIVVLAIPYAAVTEVLAQLAPHLQGRIVLDVVNPLERVNKMFRLANVAEGSAAERIQAALPHSHVVSTFKGESSELLHRIEEPLGGDVLVCADDAESRARVLELVGGIATVRAIDAGPLLNARALEAMTPLLLNLNRQYRAITSIEIRGLRA